MSQETEEIKPFIIEENIPRRSRNPIDEKDPVYRQMKVTMEAMEASKTKSFFVPVNGHKVSLLKRFVVHIEDKINRLIPLDLRTVKTLRVYIVRIIRDEEKKEVGIRIWRDN